jgi:hypothetical protein
VHFNWATHDGASKASTKNYRPINLNQGFFWVGNLLWHGIYMHKNHHRKPGVFNPLHLEETVGSIMAEETAPPGTLDDDELAA